MDPEPPRPLALGHVKTALVGSATVSDPVAAPTDTVGPAAATITWLAFVVVVVPFAVAAGRWLAAPSGHLYLPDDLALIDLHTRRALAWQQQLGVFDRNNWNHPGPSYFYLLSVAYRLFGSGARAMFVGATLVNGLAAVGCVEVVRRRATPTRALWCAVWVGVLAWQLAATSPGSTTYSEGVLGALVSPWNPTVVVLPLLLFVLLCGAAVARSSLSLLAAALVGSFAVQTDISTLPLVAAVFVVASAVWSVTAVRSRRNRTPSPPHPGRRRLLAGLGAAVLALMWLPPLVQQATNDPGNLTLVYRFFTSAHAGQTLAVSLWSVVSAFGVVVLGPSAIMSSLLGGAPPHAGVAVATAVGTVVLSGLALVAGLRHRARFAAGLGGLTLVGCVTAVAAVSHVVGFVFGYLVLWAVVLPVSAVVAVGVAPFDVEAEVVRSGRRSTVRWVLAATAIVVAAVLTVRIAQLPSLAAVSDPAVGRLTQLVTPGLQRSDAVFVGDAGAGSPATRLLDTERFIGLVNQLDSRGYRPTVNHLWKVQFGPGFLTSGRERQAVVLSTWSPSSAAQPGYVGRAGDIAVVVNRSGPTTGTPTGPAPR